MLGKGTLTVWGDTATNEIIVHIRKSGKFVEVVRIGPPDPQKKPDEKKKPDFFFFFKKKNRPEN
jgi:hypothetical protein